MKPQQPFPSTGAIAAPPHSHLRCARASLPTLTAFAVAIASSVVLTLAG